MHKKFMKVLTENFGTLYFSECGNWYATSDLGEFMIVDDRSNPDVFIAKYSYEGVLVSPKAKLKVLECSRVECLYKRVAKQVDESFGGFRFKKSVMRTLSEVICEALEEAHDEVRDEVGEALDRAIAEAEVEELEDAYLEGALVGIA